MFLGVLVVVYYVLMAVDVVCFRCNKHVLIFVFVCVSVPDLVQMIVLMLSYHVHSL